MGRIPADAFDAYLALGDERSYRALAEQYGVSKRSITKRAAKEGWQQRLAAIEAAARERAEARWAESLHDVNSRHLKTLRAIQGKAISALQSLPITSGMDAVRAIDLTIKHERLILGEPGERRAVEGSVLHEHRIPMEVIAEAMRQVDAMDPFYAKPGRGSSRPQLPEIADGHADS